MKLFELPESFRFDESFFMDDNYRIGHLENGLTYYIRHNDEAPGQALLALVVKVGSLQEEEHERGLAHFLEHSVFKGTKNFPGRAFDDFLVSNGLLMGDNYNACTSHNYTSYYIDDIPLSTPGLLDGCLQIMADFSGNATLEGHSIENERGVVRSEYINSNNVHFRMLSSIKPEILCGTRNAFRPPIGSLDVIENFEHDTLRGFYKKWYHPVNQAVVAVGDFDVDDMEARIRNKFSGFSSPENPAPIVNYAIPANPEPIFVNASDRECTSSCVNVSFKLDALYEGNPEYKHAYRSYVEALTGLIDQLFNLRLSSMMEVPGNPFRKIGCNFSSSYFGDINTKCLGFECQLKELRSADGYTQLITALAQIARYGFSQEELDYVKSHVLMNLEHYINELKNVDNITMYHECLCNFVNDVDLLTPEKLSEFTGHFFGQLTLKFVNDTLGKILNSNGYNMIVYSFTTLTDNELTSENMRRIAESVFSGPVPEFKPVELTFSLMDQMPERGSITDRVYDKASDSHGWILSNGARVVYKVTDFEAGQLKFNVSSLGGASVFDDSEYPNIKVFDDVVYNSGLASLSEGQLDKYLNDKDLSYRKFFSEYSQSIYGSSSMLQLEHLMQLLYCMFTNPGTNADDFQIFLEDKMQDIINYEQNPENCLSRALGRLRYVRNNRMRRIGQDDIPKIDFDRCLEMWKNLMRDASTYTFYFVGDIDEAKLEELSEKYIASLPSTFEGIRMRPEVVDEERLPLFHRETVQLDEPKSRYFCNYVLRGLSDNIQNIVIADIAESLIDVIINEEIRTKRSWCYYSKVSINRYWDYTDAGKMEIILTLDLMLLPERGQCAQEIIDRLLDTITPQNISADVFEGIKSSIIMLHKQKLMVNKYWVWALEQLYFKGQNLFEGYCELAEQITLDQVCGFVRMILTRAIKQAFLILPRGVEQADN